MFVDTAKIHIKAGNGGNGLVSFRREKYVAAGGPDGGDGGDGGSVLFRVDTGMTTLADFAHRKHYAAKNGEDGKARNSFGRKGENLEIFVPLGTLVREAESGKIMKDLSDPNETYLAAKGGSGGWGNVHFATPTRQAPKFANNGTAGQEFDLILELKLIADVGLAGFPNVGKSTLLSRVSDARPKIANYHFTTLEPNLGVVSLEDGKSFVLADIPGLIEGAHEGVGLGHEFLRHIERTRLIIHVVDVSGIEGRNPIDDFEKINSELLLYGEALAKLPQIVAANKTDILTDESLLVAFRDYVAERELPYFEISAATGQGVRELMLNAAARLETLEPITVFEPEYQMAAAADSVPFTIEKDGDCYVVAGPYIDKLMRSVNFGDEESVQYFQLALRRKGVIDALRSAGCGEGDPVRMAEMEFDFTE